MNIILWRKQLPAGARVLWRMLLAFSSTAEAEAHTRTRQQLYDSEKSLRVHVRMAADLLETLESTRAQHREDMLQQQQLTDRLQQKLNDLSERLEQISGAHAAPRLASQPQQSQPPAPPELAAVMRYVHGHHSRSRQRSVLWAWRSHCEKVHMLRNMRNLVESRQATVRPPLPVPPPLHQPAPSVFPPASGANARLRWRLAVSEVLRARQPRVVYTTVVQSRVPRVSEPGGGPRSSGSQIHERQGAPRPGKSATDGSAVRERAAATPSAPERWLAWLAGGEAENLPNHTSARALDERGSSAANVADEPSTALAVRLQHVVTENRFLRERIAMVEAQVQPLLAELSEKRELLHHAYVLCHRALRGTASVADGMSDFAPGGVVSSQVVTDWARGAASSGDGLASTTADQLALVGRSRKPDACSSVEDAMEAVLEDTLRLNRRLEARLELLQPRGTATAQRTLERAAT